MSVRQFLGFAPRWLVVTMIVCMGVVFAACTSQQRAGESAGEASRLPQTPSAMSQHQYKKPSEADLKKQLTPLQYRVTQHDATEPPFQNQFWDNHARGLYVDVVTGEPLFSSNDKFDSGTGWPSFTKPVEVERVVSKSDVTLGMMRTEVRSRAGDSHLGHVFDDGPAPSRQRYCINSASLRFVPVAQLAAEGYGAYAQAFGAAAGASAGAPSAASDNSCALPKPGEAPGCQTTLETAILAGGCFWGMQELLREIPGVLETDAGYTGGAIQNPRYEDLHSGTSGHAEAVRVVFDPKLLSYEDLLSKWFFRMHDPTTLDRQGNDQGSQYRSAIFFTSDAQRDTALAVKKKIAESGKWKSPIVTEVTRAGTFWPAEDYHQDYLQKHPSGYTCHWLRKWD